MYKTNFKKYFVASAIAVSVSTSVQAANYKHVAVAPQDMAEQKLAKAQSKGIFSHSTMLPISASALAGKMAFEQKISLDGSMNSPIVLLSPNAADLTMKVTNPLGKVVYDEANAPSAKALSQVQVGPQSFSGKEYAIESPVAGQWTVSLSYKNGKKPVMSAKGDKDVIGYIAFKGDSNFQAFSYLDNNFTTLNNDINIVAYMVDATHHRGDRAKMIAKEAAFNAIDSAVAAVKSPSGKQYQIKLNDDGINGDKIAGDGKFSGKMPSDEVGVYISQVQFNGHHASGKQFSRTTTDIYPIAQKSFDFDKGVAAIKPAGGNSAVLSVPVKQLADSESVHLSAEIWGTDSNGQLQSAAWVGGIVEPKGNQLALNFDSRWLTRKGLKAPYQLQSVRLQTVDGNVPLAQLDTMSAKATGIFRPAGLERVQSKAITPEMLMGKSPEIKNNQSSAASGSKLLLVHGYCSGQAWLESHFNDAVEFKDYKQNISHNTFAQRVRDFGASYNSFGVVAHSQGGAASLELYSKFWSGLDNASGGSLIQSVGTPYQGTALAGNLAALGDVFGAGCGKNTDLTYNGASNWLATIPSWAKAKVDYYTTSFETKWWRYDYCHLATDLFLDDPEDGTTEKWSGQLSGANNKGHKIGQCHTSGMRDPQQTRDTGRNSTMSNNAAR